MTETSSPTVWRRWPAFELVRLRQEAGLDQKAVAKALRCTVGKVSYAEALARRGTAERAEEEIARHVKLRMARQAVLHREPEPLRLWVVLDEAALRRVVGNPIAMKTQLRHLATMARHPKITVQVVPYANGAHPGVTGCFQILDFPWPTDPGVVYIEYRSAALYLEEVHEIEAHTVAFEHTCVLALSPDDSATMIRDAAEEFS